MEDSEQRKKRLKEMRMQADQAEVSGGIGSSAMPSVLSNPLIEAPSTMPSQDRSYAAPRFDYYTDPMSAFSSNKRNNASVQAAPDNFPPSKLGGSPVAQYLSPHPESTNSQVTPPPTHLSPAAYRNPVWSGPRGPPPYNFPFHPSSCGTYPSPRFEPSGGPSYYSTQGIAHRPSFSPNNYAQGTAHIPNYSPSNPAQGITHQPSFSSNNYAQGTAHIPNYSPNNPAQGITHPRRYSPNPSPGYRNSPISPGQGRGRGFCRNTGSPVSGRGNFHGYRSNENRSRGPAQFYKSSMVEDPWKHLEPIIWKANGGSLNTSHIPENSKPWISKSTSTKTEGSSAAPASDKSSSEPSLAEYLAAAFKEAANDAENA